MPSFSVIAVAVVFALAGCALLAVAWASWTQKLSANRFAGVRTPATMRSDEAFKLANKIAAPGVAAGGAVMVLTAIGALALPAPLGFAVAVLLGALVSLLPIGYGAYVGNKAADRLPVSAASAPTCPYSAEACASGSGCGSAKLCGH
ncbi:MAG: SdpI family protein [Segniliparus sp.]|uniref:SdpI family protein n=1 Tax=Segniliparus sp. TaxID=2804064 RepID=UPI003F372373